jgi:rod shape-determining protein MreD
VLVFWSVHQPLRVGIGAAFVLRPVHGRAPDRAAGPACAGLHGVLSFFAITIHRRLLWFSVPSQAVQVLPLFVAAHAIELAIRHAQRRRLPGLADVLAPLIEAALWPSSASCCWHRSAARPDPDENPAAVTARPLRPRMDPL